MTKRELNKLVQIARERFVTLENRADLETMRSDELDFFDVAVWEIKAALADAYEMGKAAGRKEAKQ